jgi:DNA-binding transcriptional MerR regulator
MQQGAAEQVKSPEAFRTISEVADDLDVPQHVLRFWESRFSQIKPVKRAGARRYYRPEDVDLIRGIRALLYTEGFTIKGAQKILRDKGVRYVAELGRGEAAPQAGKRAGGGRQKKDETFRALRAVDFSEEPLPQDASRGDESPPVGLLPESASVGSVEDTYIASDKAAPQPLQPTLFGDPSPANAAASMPAEDDRSGKTPTLTAAKRAKLEKLLGNLLALKAQLAATSGY